MAEGKRYFVSGHYSVSGRPKMETELMRRAVAYYLHTVICDLGQMADFVMLMQDRLAAENPRWKKVRITWYEMEGGREVRFRIGEQHLTLLMIREVGR